MRILFQLFLIVSTSFVVFGCGPRYFVTATAERPALFVASAYTREGCLEKLEADSSKVGFQIKILSVKKEEGWKRILFPFYKSYYCTAAVTGRAVPSH